MNPTAEEVVASFTHHYARADGLMEPGQQWYRESQRFARGLVREYGGTLSRSAGIIAALSPRQQWVVNKRAAEQVMRDGTTSHGFRQNTEKAERIYNGERPLTVLSGRKTVAFYRAIMGNENAAVIDVWMQKAANWPKPSVTDREYDFLADCLKEAAGLADTGVATFQAIVWTSMRGRAR